MGYAVSNGTITALTNATVAYGVTMTQPTRDLLAAMGHSITGGATEEFVTVPGLPNTVTVANIDGATYEARVSAAVVYAVTHGKTSCLVNQSYNANLVTFSTAIHMMREGGNMSLDECDVQAYGAKGDGIQDDTAAIQAAINRAMAAPGRYVRFPNFPNTAPSNSNNYLITSGLTGTGAGALRMYGDLTVTSAASGKRGPIIVGNFNGTLLTIDGNNAFGFVLRGIGLRQINTGTSAKCLTYTRVVTPSSIDDCYVSSGFDGIIGGADSFGVSLRNVYFESSTFAGTGLFVFGHHTLQTLTFVGWKVGFMHGGGGGTFWGGGRCEVNETAIILGQDYATGARASTFGLTISGISFEANDTAVYIRALNSGTLNGFHISGSANSPSGTAVYGLRISNTSGSEISSIDVQTLGVPWVVGGVVVESVALTSMVFLTLMAVRSYNPSTNAWVIPNESGTSGFNPPGLRLINCNAPQPFYTVDDNNGSVPDSYQSSLGGPLILKLSYSFAHTITNFTNGLVGNPLVLQATNGNATLQHGTNIFLKSGANKTLAANETITLMQFTGGRWDEI